MDLMDIGKPVTLILRNGCLKKSPLIDDTLNSMQNLAVSLFVADVFPDDDWFSRN